MAPRRQETPMNVSIVGPNGGLFTECRPDHSTPTTLCRPDQANALLKLKQSFMFHSYAMFNLFDSNSITTLPSWQASMDCCIWEGVGCSNSSGHVTALNLSGFGLYSYGIDPVLFNLASLRLLDLSINNFGDQSYELPSIGFERLALLTHLNLSGSGISGQVPIGISKLTNLVSLDLSNRYIFTDGSNYGTCSGTPNVLSVWEPDFQTLVANLSNLRELYLDVVSISSSTAEDCFKALAKSVPHLRVLSLEGCMLQGHIDRSLSRLTLHVKSSYFSNFKALTELRLDGEIISRSFLSSSGMLPSLRKLVLSRLGLSRELESIFSWFEGLSNLRSLHFYNCDLSMTIPSYIGNLKSLTSLVISYSNLTTQTLSAVAKIRNLKFFTIDSCVCLGQLPSAIGNMTSLESLDISDCQLSGPIPQEVGALNKLTSLVLLLTGLSGRIPSSIANLTQLTQLRLDR